MTEIKYGLISRTDAATLEKTIDLVCNEFKDEVINFCEIGVYAGQTAMGVMDYILSKCREPIYTGIESFKDGQQLVQFPPDHRIVFGNSSEVYNQLEDNSQHMIFCDGDHSFIGVISDFFAYADKVKVGGYFCFHDTGKHIAQFKDFQHGDKDNPDAYISCRKALTKIGVLPIENNEYEKYFQGWELIFDEADETNPAGGVTVFKKLY